MTPQDGQISTESTGQAKRIPAGFPPPGLLVPAGPASSSFEWEHIYHNLSEKERHDLLALAHRQGVLYGHQLPVSRNGVARNGDSFSADASNVLGRILTGRADELPPIETNGVFPASDQLDPAQQEAVLKALATPDI